MQHWTHIAQWLDSGFHYDVAVLAVIASTVAVVLAVARRQYGAAPRSHVAQHRNVSQR